MVAIATAVKQLADDHPLLGVGGSFPGFVDEVRGSIISSSNLPEWEGQPIKQRLSELLSAPVQIFHDVAVAAMGEAYYGHGQTAASLVFLIWGTGFGGAKVEKLAGGPHISSFEPGHYYADPQGEACDCGQRGCPELWLGGGALSRRLGKNLAEVTVDDPVWDTVVEVALRTVANVHAFHPTPLIVFGGGMVLNKPFLFDRVTALTQTTKFVAEKPEFKLSKLGDDAALYGAVVLQQSLYV